MKNKEHMCVEDVAKERAPAKDNYGMDTDPSSSIVSLLHMSALVEVDFGKYGCSIEIVDRNLDIIKKMKQVRKDFFLQNIVNKKMVMIYLADKVLFTLGMLLFMSCVTLGTFIC